MYDRLCAQAQKGVTGLEWAAVSYRCAHVWRTACRRIDGPSSRSDSKGLRNDHGVHDVPLGKCSELPRWFSRPHPHALFRYMASALKQKCLDMRRREASRRESQHFAASNCVFVLFKLAFCIFVSSSWTPSVGPDAPKATPQKMDARNLLAYFKRKDTEACGTGNILQHVHKSKNPMNLRKVRRSSYS